ncbi:sulfide:quinone oxidoreductase, mitochondrial-like [Dysidea avara]|uniref:sulfide:quinone oxidoreductase, mitochondrial-like n=1 Tax=Dysidea avara TaxID=196820 RepID=UPI0033333882
MVSLLRTSLAPVGKAIAAQHFSTAAVLSNDSYRFVVAGGGAGGLAIASSLARKYGDGNVAVIEPSDVHYYQPMWTLVGGGEKTLQDSAKEMSKLMPKNATWIKEKVEQFDPAQNLVYTSDNRKVNYDYLVVAMGLQVNFNKIEGLPEALEDPASGVASNFSPKYVNKTFELIKNFQGGNAIFTMPTLPIKCPGAPQKIMYLAEDYFRNKSGVRDKTTVMYNSALAVLFGVKKYANSLWKVVERKGIQVNLHTNLVEVMSKEKKAMFTITNPADNTTTNKIFDYDMIHVSPPMGPLACLKDSPVSDANGWVDVNKTTLQHMRFPNVFAIGDCSNVPTSKTAAAVAGQSGVLLKSLESVMKGEIPAEKYDGYTSCPLITGYGTTILAEFDFNAAPLETFPIDQGKERTSMYYLKRDIMPELYWSGLLRGVWRGPGIVRKALHAGLKN